MNNKKRKIHVAFCLRDLKVGGVESVLTRTLDKLSHYRDLDITVITYTPIRDVWRDWFASHKNISVRTLYPSRFLGTDLPHFFVWRLLKHIARDVYRWTRRKFFNNRAFRDIDVIVDYYDFDCVREVEKLPISKIAWWHSSSAKFHNGGYVHHIANYNRFVVLTDAFADELRQQYPTYAEKIMRIYNPIDVDVVRQMAGVAPTRDGDYFVSVSRLVNGKDIETLIRAFDKFWRKNNKPNVDLLIVGDGYARARFESVAHGVGAKNHIVFTGTVNNPFGLMHDARANILSSVGEGFAIVLIESAAVGTLNIASDCAYGPREVLMDGRAGLLFNVGDTDVLANYMDAVWNNTVNVKKMVNVATKNMKRFDANEISEKIHNLILDTH